MTFTHNDKYFSTITENNILKVNVKQKYCANVNRSAKVRRLIFFLLPLHVNALNLLLDNEHSNHAFVHSTHPYQAASTLDLKQGWMTGINNALVSSLKNGVCFHFCPSLRKLTKDRSLPLSYRMQQ